MKLVFFKIFLYHRIKSSLNVKGQSHVKLKYFGNRNYLNKNEKKIRKMAWRQAFRSAKVGSYFCIAFPKSKLKFNSFHHQSMDWNFTYYFIIYIILNNISEICLVGLIEMKGTRNNRIMSTIIPISQLDVN